jgi:hypothetical protein
VKISSLSFSLGVSFIGASIHFAVLGFFVCAFGLLFTPFDVCALLVDLFSSRSIGSPLCGAAVTFFAAAKKVTKESSYRASGVRRSSP